MSLLRCLHRVGGLWGVRLCGRSMCFSLVVLTGLVGCGVSFCVVGLCVFLLRCLHWVGGMWGVPGLCVFALLSSLGWWVVGCPFVYVFLLCCLHRVGGLRGVLLCGRSMCFCFIVFTGLSGVLLCMFFCFVVFTGFVGCGVSFFVVGLCVFALLSSMVW